MNNIKILSKILVQNHFEKLNLLTQKKKLNTRSMYFWLVVIVCITVTMVSQLVVSELAKYGLEYIFAKGIIIFLTGVVLFQTLVILLNMLFFSNDINRYLPFPISSKELLISRYIGALSIIYMCEVFVALIPLLVYLTYAGTGIVGLIQILSALILMPIIVLNAMLIINFILVNIAKKIRNKKIYQSIASTIFMIVFSGGSSLFIVKLLQMEHENIDTFLDVVNRILVLPEIFYNIVVGQNAVVHMLITAIVSIITFWISVNICEKKYIKILKNFNNYSKEIKIKAVKLNKIKPKKSEYAYLKNDILKILRVPEFLVQLFYPVVMLHGTIIMLGVALITKILISDESLQTTLKEMQFNTQGFGTLLGVIILLISLNKISLTAISRQGQEAKMIKAWPIALKKQFVIKNIPQIFLNSITITLVSVVAYNLYPNMNAWHTVALFVTAMAINKSMSYLEVLVDCKKPNLNWISKVEITKQNSNMMYKYVITIVNILIVMYLSSILTKGQVGLEVSIIIIMVIEIIIFALINIAISRLLKKQKLFNKIN